MYGIPFLGDGHYEKTSRLANNLVKQPLSLNSLREKAVESGVTEPVDLYSLFLCLAELDWLFLIEKDVASDFSFDRYRLSWCTDIRFNYRDKEIFIPYYDYDTETYTGDKRYKDESKLNRISDDTIMVNYFFRFRRQILDDRKTGFRSDSILVVNPATLVLYDISIKDLPYLTSPEFSFSTLYDRYLDSAYVESDLDAENWKRYIRNDNKFKNNREHLLRNHLDLPLYGEGYKDYTYVDVRMYTWEELTGSLMYDDENRPYWRRKLLFESYLYCGMAGDHTPVEAEYGKDYQRLGVDLRTLTINKGNKPLILKYYYKNNFSMRRKTFERYKEK